MCEQAKRQFEIQTGIKAQVILPTPGQKTNRQTEQTKSSLGPKEKSVCLFVCFVALRPKSTAMVIAGRSVHLTTLFPGQA